MPTLSQMSLLDHKMVAPLADFDRHDLALAGGKGANLGELIRAGFDVPPGFVITTSAYERMLHANGLDRQLEGLLAGLDRADTVGVARVSGRIRSGIENAPIPAPLADEILASYRSLGSAAVAVRSSATAEDLPGAAFAGQQETFLNVQGEAALLQAVRACWASLWSERAILYRFRQGVEQASVRLAVVVQRMVPADAAGVMFTADPVSGERGKLAIDASPGLGEAVVAGLVTPDHTVVDKRTLRIEEHRPGRREVIVRPRPGGGTEQVAASMNGDADHALPPSALRRLAQLGVRIERHFGAPQDIEWAWTASSATLLILQARPMTALPEPLKVSGPLRAVVPMLAEMWPDRPYPLDVTTFTGAVEKSIGALLAGIIGRGAPDPEKVLLEDEGVVVRFDLPKVRPFPGILLNPWLALWRTRRYSPTRWQADPLLAEAEAQARALGRLDPVSLSWSRNLETMQAALALIPRFMQLRERDFPRALAGLGGLWLLLRLARRGSSLGALIGGVETKTVEINRALEALAAQVRGDAGLRKLFDRLPEGGLQPALAASPSGRGFLEEFGRFLDRHGHRETSLTISQPAWKDDPQIVLGLLKVLVEGRPRPMEDPPAWERARDELLANSILKRWPWRRPFLACLAGARSLLQLREDTHYYATLLQPPLRHAALGLGRRLAQAGGLETAADVFHLRLDELEALDASWPPPKADLERTRVLAARRKAKRAALAGTPLVDPRLLGDGAAAGADDHVLLSGSPGSPGSASGPVRVVRSASEFGRLQPGEVLVAPVTNPAWTPLFQRAAAVVVDTGGPASHAAIVAREYGLPAVMGTRDGTRRLSDGQRVRVDGSRGLIYREESE